MIAARNWASKTNCANCRVSATAMLVAVGEDQRQDDGRFAGYAVDDLVGSVNARTVKPSLCANFSSFDVSRVDAEQMVLTARLKAGWITERTGIGTGREAEVGEEEAASLEAAGIKKSRMASYVWCNSGVSYAALAIIPENGRHSFR